MRQVKDLQHQATKLISGKPNVQSIEQFGKYAEEIKAFLKKEELIPELKKLVNEIPSIPQNKITPRSGALALLAPNFLMYWIYEKEYISKSLPIVEQARGKFASIEFIMKNMID